MTPEPIAYLSNVTIPGRDPWAKLQRRARRLVDLTFESSVPFEYTAALNLVRRITLAWLVTPAGKKWRGVWI